MKSSNLIWVSLVQKAEGTKWADEPGPLKLVAIDTGAGKMLLREDVSFCPPPRVSEYGVVVMPFGAPRNVVYFSVVLLSRTAKYMTLPEPTIARLTLWRRRDGCLRLP